MADKVWFQDSIHVLLSLLYQFIDKDIDIKFKKELLGFLIKIGEGRKIIWNIMFIDALIK